MKLSKWGFSLSLFFVLIISYILGAPASFASTLGTKQVLVVPIKFTDTVQTVLVPAKQEFGQLIFGQSGAKSLKGYIDENSKSQFSISGTVVDWVPLAMPTPTACLTSNMNSVRSLALQHVTQRDGLNPANYDLYIFVLPAPCAAHFNYSISDSIFLPIDPTQSNVYSYKVVAHEFGHWLGLSHSDKLSCVGNSISNVGCTVADAGDFFDIMGGDGHFKPTSKEQLGWLHATNIYNATSSDLLILEPYEKNTYGMQVLKIPRGNGDSFGDNLYVEFRQPLGYGNEVITAMHRGGDGLILRTSSYLVEATPVTAVSNSETVLEQGKTFVDPSSGTRVELTQLVRDFAFPQNSRATVKITQGKSDLTGPSVHVVSHTQGQNISGTQIFKASVADPSGIEKVEFYINNNLVKVATTTSPSGLYEATWDSGSFPNGTAQLEVKAYDKSCLTVSGCRYGNVASTYVQLNVQNTYADITPPNVLLNRPLSGTVSNPVELRPSSWDTYGGSGVSELKVFIDNSPTPAYDYSNADPAALSFSFTEYMLLPAGNHTAYAWAKDVAANIATSSIVHFSVVGDTQPPSVTIVSPLSNALVTGTSVPVSVFADDNVWVEAVELYVDGSLLETSLWKFQDHQEPLQLGGYRNPPVKKNNFIFYINPSALSNGTHVVSVRAIDGFGLPSASSQIQVHVNNSTATKINFQPSASVAPSGYIADTGAVYSSARKYGWDVAIASRDRGLSNQDPLSTFVSTSANSTRVWNYDIANGNYLVSLASGDYTYAQGAHRVEIEGVTVVNDVKTAKGSFVTLSDIPVTVTDGKLTIKLGGTSGSTLLNYVTIKPSMGPQAPILNPIGPQAVTVGALLRFSISATDADTASSSLVYAATNVPLGAVFDPNTKTFSWSPVSGQEGTYNVTFLVGDGSLVDSETVSIVVSPQPSQIQYKINFQPSSSTIPAGYAMDSGGVYLASRGYGWDSVVSTRDRLVGSQDPLKTFVTTSSNVVRTWNFDLPNGNYLVTLSSGDFSYNQGPHRVEVEGVRVVDDVVTTKNNYAYVVDYPVTVLDGKLTMKVGGAAGNTMVNYIVITKN